MTREAAPRDVELLLVDGNNLLHRTHGAVSPGAQRALLGQLRAALPGVVKVVVFDGHRREADETAHGGQGGVQLRYANGPADEALLELIEATAWSRRGWTLLVTDDRALTERARSAGARTARLDWLVGLLGRQRPTRNPGLGNTRGSAAARPSRGKAERGAAAPTPASRSLATPRRRRTDR